MFRIGKSGLAALEASIARGPADAEAGRTKLVDKVLNRLEAKLSRLKTRATSLEERYWLSGWVPNRTPGCELGWAYLIASKIALTESEEFSLGDIDEMFAIFSGDKFTRNCHEMRALAVQRCAHVIAQWSAIAKAEGIGFAQRLAYGARSAQL